ncbi:MAG TPA: alpha/beta fold hydrolase [Casimicrobiaceae bacterium]|nr:alpha/beta fold hydrolase [Casimicrobiaceae bacterium]
MHQEIQYCTASDGVRLAYSIISKGTPIVRTPHWFAHLEYDLKGPIFRHQILGLAHYHSLLRYDARGMGLSQRDVADTSFDRQVEDLETVIDSAGLERFVLVGLSQGGAVAIAYASRHPERLTHLIIYGAFARGLLHRENLEKQKQILELSRALVREGWGSDQDSYREFFTSQFIPAGTIEHHRWLNDVQRVAAAPEVAEQVLCTSAGINVVDLLPTVRVPTLVMHSRGDLRQPFSLGQEIAAGIPGAKFVPLESRNHVILADEPANRQFFDATALFLGDRRIRGTLPGTATFKERAQRSVAAIERYWLIKVIVVLAALAGATISFLQLFRLLHN